MFEFKHLVPQLQNANCPKHTHHRPKVIRDQAPIASRARDRDSVADESRIATPPEH
jgi:hypothetical protein